MIIPNFHHFGARQTETGALRNALEYVGITAPHTGQPYSEPLLFGIGGGIGFAYFLFEQHGTHPIHLGTRIHTKETERPEFYQRIGSGISVEVHVQNSSSASAAKTNLKRQLELGRPPIVSVDAARLPYLGLNGGVYTYYSVVVFGMDEQNDRVLVSDGCNQPLELTTEQFLQARDSSWSPKYRSVSVVKGEGEPDIRAAVLGGIHECARQMHEGLGITNFGLRGMEKWATVLTSAKEKKSWPKIFSPGPLLYEALFSIFSQIATRSGAGNANRAFYADFLDEAADLLERPALREAAELYRRADEEWGEVAASHLPSQVPVFAEVKELAIRRRSRFESKGPDAAEEIEQIRNRLNAIHTEMGENFPISFQDSRALLNDLQGRILKLRETEAEALRALESAIAA